MTEFNLDADWVHSEVKRLGYKNIKDIFMLVLTVMDNSSLYYAEILSVVLNVGFVGN